jgi:hypothetical protein
VLADAEAALELAFLPSDWQLLEFITEEPALVRSGSQSLRFGDNEFSVEVDVRGRPWRIQLIGLVTPVTDIEVCSGTGRWRVDPDAAGFFRVDDLPRGPVRLVIGQTRATPWFRP